MQRLTILTHFRGTAAEPSGEPPQTDPRASSVSVEVVQEDGSGDRIERASYENHATFTGASTFAETGSIRYDDHDELQIATLSDGTLGPHRSQTCCTAPRSTASPGAAAGSREPAV